MPHCTIEYSPSVTTIASPQKMVSLVHEAALSTDLFHPDAIKTRAFEVNAFQLGENLQGFIHVTLAIMPGRTLEQKNNLSSSVIAVLANLQLTATSITVEIRDINRETYKKHV